VEIPDSGVLDGFLLPKLNYGVYFLGLYRRMGQKSLLQLMPHRPVVGSAVVIDSILVAFPVPLLLIRPGGITAASAAFLPSLDLAWRIH
jgi:hypothetical protein